MTKFITKSEAVQVAIANHTDDNVWGYYPTESEGGWIVEVFDEDGILLGAL